jgi:hypothetical protein
MASVAFIFYIKTDYIIGLCAIVLENLGVGKWLSGMDTTRWLNYRSAHPG